MHRESHFGNFAAEKVQAAIVDTLQRGLVMVSLSDAGLPVGSVGLAPDQPWWSTDWQMEERWFFVHPDYRRLGHARVLLQAAVRAAAAARLPLLMAHVGTRAKGKMRLYARELGEPVGGIFFVRAPAAGG
jgi:GNAT superfamily N-acetyltransferase